MIFSLYEFDGSVDVFEMVLFKKFFVVCIGMTSLFSFIIVVSRLM